MGRKQPQNIELLLVPTTHSDASIIGFHAIPERLVQVDRLPGESLKSMLHRALWMVRGPGPALVYPRTTTKG
jgi:hypothetical protein